MERSQINHEIKSYQKKIVNSFYMIWFLRVSRYNRSLFLRRPTLKVRFLSRAGRWTSALSEHGLELILPLILWVATSITFATARCRYAKTFKGFVETWTTFNSILLLLLLTASSCLLTLISDFLCYVGLMMGLKRLFGGTEFLWVRGGMVYFSETSFVIPRGLISKVE